MDIVTQIKQQNKCYLPHELSTKINSVKLYRQVKDIDFVIRRYHISPIVLNLSLAVSGRDLEFGILSHACLLSCKPGVDLTLTLSQQKCQLSLQALHG